MTAIPEGEQQSRARPAETVAGFLAALAIFIALIGVIWHPLRLVPPAIVIALIAAAMGGERHQRLTFAAVMIAAASFFFGLLFAVIATRPLW